TLIPVVQLFFISLTDQNIFGKGDFVGIANFQKLMGDPLFQRSFVNTLYFAVLHVPLTIVVSLGLALLLNSKLRGVAFFRTAAFFPYITSIVAVGLVWNLLFSPEYGPINEVLRFFGIADPPGWLPSQDWAMPAIVIISTWRDMGYYMILFLAGLQTVSPEPYEAARMDGADVRQIFCNVTLPGIRPTMFLVTGLLSIAALEVFDLILVLSPGGTAARNVAAVVRSQVISQRGFIESKFGYASSAAVVRFLLGIVTTVIQFLINKKRSA